MGFYGAGLFEGTAESLIVTDTEEAWIFHILPDPSGASAIWAAQRVPDDSFAVVPNVFIIREIDASDDNFMYSSSVYSVATELGWFDPDDDKLLDFTATYSDGEYSHQFYSGRRSWGVYSMFAPSLQLEADYVEWRISKPYPFAAKPDKKLSVTDVANAMRSYYEGTDFSQAGETSGINLAGGPFRTPDHVAGGNSTPFEILNEDGDTGNWERTIGLYRTSDSYITQSRGWLEDAHGGIIWFGPYAAPYSVFVPFAAGMKSLPHATLGNHMRLDKKTLFWAFRYLGNYVQNKYEAMMGEVTAFQQHAMQRSLELQASIDSLMNGGESSDSVLELYSANANKVLEETWEFSDHLMFKFADGQVHATPTDVQYGTSTPPRKYSVKGVTTKEAPIVDQPGYRTEWLEKVGFLDGPPPPPNCEDLDWQCGHAPSSSSVSNSGLRSESTKDDASNNASTQAWIVYIQGKERALRSNTVTCDAVGDVAAAVKKCSPRSMQKNVQHVLSVSPVQPNGGGQKETGRV
mmetsp:Transcript_36582/g.74537  ORF Transcript_36582/g.74537 Transcript_36582/m.74537 type:complete len:519 (+) Transcript_36582:2-1558(+)